MADIENRLTSLESSVNEILVEIRGIKLEILAAKGESEAAAPLLELRLRKVESAVGLFELGSGRNYRDDDKDGGLETAIGALR